jgi:hypothetical protein
MKLTKDELVEWERILRSKGLGMAAESNQWHLECGWEEKR